MKRVANCIRQAAAWFYTRGCLAEAKNRLWTALPYHLAAAFLIYLVQPFPMREEAKAQEGLDPLCRCLLPVKCEQDFFNPLEEGESDAF